MERITLEAASSLVVLWLPDEHLAGRDRVAEGSLGCDSSPGGDHGLALDGCLCGLSASHWGCCNGGEHGLHGVLSVEDKRRSSVQTASAV